MRRIIDKTLIDGGYPQRKIVFMNFHYLYNTYAEKLCFYYFFIVNTLLKFIDFRKNISKNILLFTIY